MIVSRPLYPEHVDQNINLSQILPILKEMLDYCGAVALESNEVGSLAYDCDLDEVVYHLKVRGFDASLFDTLHGVEEIWIIQSGGQES